DFTMSVGSMSETVTVTAESPIVDSERAGLSVNINSQALTSIPVTTNRRFQDAWLVVPGVSVNPATQELTGSERRTSLDGADVTDPYGGDIFAVQVQKRGNLWFLKGTMQLAAEHRLQVSVQYDRTIQANAIWRGTVGPNRNLGVLTSSTSTGLGTSNPQIVAPSALGTLVK